MRSVPYPTAAWINLSAESAGSIEGTSPQAKHSAAKLDTAVSLCKGVRLGEFDTSPLPVPVVGNPEGDCDALRDGELLVGKIDVVFVSWDGGLVDVCNGMDGELLISKIDVVFVSWDGGLVDVCNGVDGDDCEVIWVDSGEVVAGEVRDTVVLGTVALSNLSSYMGSFS